MELRDDILARISVFMLILIIVILLIWYAAKLVLEGRIITSCTRCGETLELYSGPTVDGTKLYLCKGCFEKAVQGKR